MQTNYPPSVETPQTSKNSFQRGLRRIRHYIKVFKIPLIIFLLIVAVVVVGRLMPQIYVAHFLVKPPVVVSAENAKRESWNQQIRVIGSLSAENSVMIAPEIGGIVSEIPHSGKTVKKGDLILRLNDNVEKAELQRLEAQLAYSEASLSRSKKLKKGNVETQANLEQKEAKNIEDLASVNQAKAVIAKKNIIAPFDGILGIVQINLGEYLQPGTPTISLTDARNLYIDFSVPERYRDILKINEKVIFKVDAFADQEFEGLLTTIDPQINEQTRNIDVQGIFKNEDLKLSAGMFADIRVILPKKESVVTISQTAVDYGLYGSTVFVLEEEEPKNGSLEKPQNNPVDESPKVYHVKRRNVTTGEIQKGRIAIMSGLKEGDHVVSAGQLKLETGATVVLSKTPPPPIPTQLTNE